MCCIQNTTAFQAVLNYFIFSTTSNTNQSGQNKKEWPLWKIYVGLKVANSSTVVCAESAGLGQDDGRPSVLSSLHCQSFPEVVTMLTFSLTKYFLIEYL